MQDIYIVTTIILKRVKEVSCLIVVHGSSLNHRTISLDCCDLCHFFAFYVLFYSPKCSFIWHFEILTNMNRAINNIVTINPTLAFFSLLIAQKCYRIDDGREINLPHHLGKVEDLCLHSEYVILTLLAESQQLSIVHINALANSHITLIAQRDEGHSTLLHKEADGVTILRGHNLSSFNGSNLLSTEIAGITELPLASILANLRENIHLLNPHTNPQQGFLGF